MASIKELAQKKKIVSPKKSQSVEEKHKEVVLKAETALEKELADIRRITKRDIKKAEPVHFYTQEAKRAYEELLEKDEYQLVDIPRDAMNEGNKVLPVVWNGVRFEFVRGRSYYVPATIAKIIFDRVNEARAVINGVKEVAMETIGSFAGKENITVTVDGEKVL